MLPPSVITIDGPAASGKTIVGRGVARRLGYRFVDTGLMYRAITWLALLRGVPLKDEAALQALSRQTAITVEADRVMVDGTDATGRLHDPPVEEAVSYVSRVQGVREAMVAQQRRMVEQRGTVMVGRDIGTHVLPDAPVKVFLMASREERGRRRHRELATEGRSPPLEEVLANLELRDTLDSERSHAPLRPADDALLLQTNGLTVEQVVQQVLELVHAR